MISKEKYKIISSQLKNVTYNIWKCENANRESDGEAKLEIYQEGFSIDECFCYSKGDYMLYFACNFTFLKTVLRDILCAICDTPGNFGTGNASDVINALFKISGRYRTTEDFIAYLKNFACCYVLYETKGAISPKILRVDLLRYLKDNKKDANKKDFVGGLLHSLKHFSIEGKNLSVGQDINDISCMDDILVYIAKAFVKCAENNTKDNVIVMQIEDGINMKFSFYYDEDKHVYFLNTCHRITIKSMQQLKPNTTLQSGKYKIVRVLGQGGFGNTYVGINTTFNDKVAIKEFFMQGINYRDDATGSITVSLERNKPQFEEQLEKFKKEALRIRKLDNPHIVKVHDLFEENGTAYYVMDYIDGENLAERLKRTGKPMNESEIRELLLQVLDALKKVHDAGIWHLDLKPANIMVDKSGNVRLIDFGASKQLNTQEGGATTSTAISYTNGYAPREQMEQNYNKFGPWTDIYALGATLYTLLTNKRPPLPTDIDDDATENKNQSLPFPSSISEDMKGLVLWMMYTNRNKRPQDVNSILFQLEDYRSEITKNDIDERTIIEESNEKKDNSISRTTKLIKKNRRLYIGLSIALVLLLCVGFIRIVNKEELKYKPKYKILSEKDKTCELFGEDFEDYITTGGLHIDFSTVSLYPVNYACIPDSANGNYDIPNHVDGYSVIRLGDYSFYKTMLSSVNVPNGVKSIGKYAFGLCDSLQILSISNGIEQIGDMCFMNDSNLAAITIPETVTSIGRAAFLNCRALKSLELSHVKQLSDSLFYSSGLESFNINKGVKKISSYVFSRTKLKDVSVPNSVDTIGYGAFADCEQIITVDLGRDRPLVLGGGTFIGCKSLKSIKIPNGVKYLNGDFRACESLTSVSLPNSIKIIWLSTFSDCKSLSSINIPNSVDSIGLGAFIRCSSLASIDIPEGVKMIGYRAFEDCKSLSSVHLPSTLAKIGSLAFNNCTNLRMVISDIQNPLNCKIGTMDPMKDAYNQWCFNYIPYDAILYVPRGTKGLYEKAGWSRFFSQVIER